MLGYYNLSLTGSSHLIMEGGVCQDASIVKVLENGWIAAVIADGLGSAAHSETGSETAVNTVISFISEHLPENWHAESLISLLRMSYHEALKAIKKAADDAEEDVCDYDTTLTALIYNGADVVYGQVGDGGIVALNPFGEFSVLTHVQKGEAFNETVPLRLGPEYWSFGSSNENICALLMMTDGIYDVAVPWLLAGTEQKIYINYIRSFIDNNLLHLSDESDFEKLQDEIKDFLTGESSARITDDKTVAGIINTDVIPEVKEDAYYMEPDWEALMKEHNERLYGKRDIVREETSVEAEAETSDEQGKPAIMERLKMVFLSLRE